MVEIFQNIRKIFRFEAPCEELSAHIEFYSETSLEKTNLYLADDIFTVKMFASWTPTFYINLSSPYYITVGNHIRQIAADEDILILRDSVVERRNMPSDNIFTVKFNPGGLEAILDISQVKCIDQIIPLHTIIPAARLQQIREPWSFEERVQLMQQYLLSCYVRKKKDHYLKMVNDAIGEYSEKGMLLNTSHVAEKIFISSKTINRYFNRVVGLSPKKYFSIIRARRALTDHLADKDRFIPYNYGYYDLSHFYKDVVKFTGKKLSEQK